MKRMLPATIKTAAMHIVILFLSCCYLLVEYWERKALQERQEQFNKKYPSATPFDKSKN